MSVYASRIETPVDEMFAAVDEDGAVLVLEFANHRTPEQAFRSLGEITWRDRRLSDLRSQLDEYFAGERREFELEIRPQGSDFQHRVWSEVRAIGYGETESYGEVAQRLGRSGASRAVGRANATNPICLITPCHRVIGADGSLTGFGGGIETKRWLLGLESAQQSL